MWLEEIENRSAKRRERWSYIECRKLPSFYRAREAVTIGAYSMSGWASGRRWIKSPACVKLSPGLETPTAIARDYLTEKYKRSPRCTHAQIVSVSQELKVNPAFAIPGTFEHGYYIDIKAAYYSILNRVGWNLDYWPGRWLRFGEPCFDFPFPDNKRARIALVSGCISSERLDHQPGKLHPERVPSNNHLLNLQLWRLVQDVLFAIMREAKSAGAIYGKTDGYIAPSYDVATKIMQVVQGWGLEFSVKKQGRGHVMGHGAYKFGRNADREFPGRAARPMSNLVEREYNVWLKDKFTKF